MTKDGGCTATDYKYSCDSSFVELIKINNGEYTWYWRRDTIPSKNSYRKSVQEILMRKKKYLNFLRNY